MHRIVPTSDLARGGSSFATLKVVDVGLALGDNTDDPVNPRTVTTCPSANATPTLNYQTL
jgi:hypothetical protein